MHLVLERNDLDVHDKANMYSQYLQNFLKTAKISKKPVSIEVRDIQSVGNVDSEQMQNVKELASDHSEPDPLELEIIPHIPKSFVIHASQLVQKLKTNGAARTTWMFYKGFRVCK